MIVDNDTADSSGLARLELPDNMQLFKTQENIGFAGGSNAGAFEACKTSEFDWIITLNPDAFPEPDWFDVVMRAASSAPEYAMLSSTLLKESDPDILDGAGDVYSIYGIAWRGGKGQPVQSLKSRESRYGSIKGFPVLGPCGAAAAYRADIFTSSGGFDPAFFCYLEDVDLALRLQLLGHKCLHCVDAKVLHMGGASSAFSDDEGTAFQYYYTYKNQLRVMIKTMPLLLLILMVPLYLAGLLWIVFRTRKHDHSGEKIKGLRDGLKSIGEIIKARRAIQTRRAVSTLRVMQLLAWSPIKLKRNDVL